MTLYRSHHYYSTAVPEAAPPEAIRAEATDWQALDPVEQTFVDLFMAGLILADALPAAGRTFVRRHHPRRMES